LTGAFQHLKLVAIAKAEGKALVIIRGLRAKRARTAAVIDSTNNRVALASASRPLIGPMAVDSDSKRFYARFANKTLEGSLIDQV